VLPVKNNRPCCALLVEIRLAQEFTRTRDDDSGFTFIGHADPRAWNIDD
jgi:hypothetical protein